jgi:oxygen-independent coproporphyrinogen-3 oxidase
MKLFKEKSSWYEKEELSGKDRFNELILTGLRTKYGVKLSALQSNHELTTVFLQKVDNYNKEGWMQQTEGVLLLTDEGKLRADYIASELFI